MLINIADNCDSMFVPNIQCFYDFPTLPSLQPQRTHKTTENTSPRQSDTTQAADTREQENKHNRQQVGGERGKGGTGYTCPSLIKIITQPI